MSQFDLTTLEPGHHSCFLFEDFDDQLSTTIPFLKLGLAKKEKCLFLSDPLTVEKVRKKLNAAGVSVDSEEKCGALVLTSARDYLVNGRFNSKRMVTFLEAALEGALKEGFTGFRATGDV